jgi:hypothetical protein
MSDLEHIKCAGPCGKLKPEYEFPRSARSRTGRMSICKACHVEKCRRRDRAVLIGPVSNMARYTPKSTPVPMPVETTATEVESIKRRCTCTPRKHYVVEKMRRRVYTAHSALCMIFAHNQPDQVCRGSSLDDEGTKYGSW